MKLLVSGGAGFIGSAVVRRAVRDGHYVMNLDALTYAACLDNLASVADAPNYQFVQANVRNRAQLDAVFESFQPDAVMHLAAESHVDRSIDGPGDFMETNIMGTYHMLEAARAFWVDIGKLDTFRFHHVSTDEVFGSLPDDPSVMFTEHTRYDPRSPYAASKASSDHLVRAWSETFGLPILVTNCSNNYGPYQFPEKLVPVAILSALAGKRIPLYGKGDNVRDWLYVEDHVDALLSIIQRGQANRSYNIGGESEVQNVQIVQMICTLLDRLCPADKSYGDLITFVSDRPGHDQRYAIDPTRIRDELGWRPSVTLEQGLEKTVQWYLDNKAWWKALQNRNEESERQGVKA